MHDMPMDRWISTFLEAEAATRNAARNTLLAYGRDLKDLASWLARRGRHFADCTREDIEGWLIDCDAQGLSVATRARRLSSARQLFRFAHDEGWRENDPGQRIKGPGAVRSLPRTLGEAQVDALLDQARRHGRTDADRLRNSCLMELLYATGLRVTELVSLPLQTVLGDPEMILVRGKGDRERMVPLSGPARAAIRAWLPARAAGLKPRETSRFLFPSRSAEGHLTRLRFHGLIKEIALAAGINPDLVTPHVLRHAFASHLLANGADLRVIQMLMGHADLATTEIYTHVQDAHLRELVLTRHPLANARS